MLAISVNQPYASIIAAGAKLVETRDWKPYPNKLKPGDRVAIHATKNFPQWAKEICQEPRFFQALWPDIQGYRNTQESPYPADWFMKIDDLYYSIDEIERRTEALPRGVIVATARIAAFRSTNDDDFIDELSQQEMQFGNYASDRWGWVLEDVQALDEPIPARGQLGIWQWEKKTA